MRGIVLFEWNAEGAERNRDYHRSGSTARNIRGIFRGVLNRFIFAFTNGDSHRRVSDTKVLSIIISILQITIRFLTLDSRFDKRIVSHFKKFASQILVNPRSDFSFLSICKFDREKSKIEIDNAICARDATSAHVNIENDGMGG
ncbi:PREDICTED: uncharacterized protein LOC105457846 [Wasmannia auropunctata]|uniref:uncharacterized protein LOC105457846 n=1 Tax=Wasmannia auropunctata TaxID=64793 RepID=UPI0005F00767|nr:PREDICTED: uncharacterized protein LOC105457846 [Wasmannia auropunctata]